MKNAHKTQSGRRTERHARPAILFPVGNSSRFYIIKSLRGISSELHSNFTRTCPNVDRDYCFGILLTRDD